MRALILQAPRNLPVGLSMAIWLAAFLSPTAYILFLLIADKALILPRSAAGALLWMVPVVALLAPLVCVIVVWRSKMTFGWRVGGLVVTALGMLLQFGVWFVFMLNVINAAIALP